MNPYAKDLGTRDAKDALAETPERIRQLLAGMQESDFDRTYGADKWTAAQLVEHIAEAEMIFSLRLRMALTHENYVVQPYDQDRFLAREPKRTGREAFAVYDAVRRWNLPLYRSVTATERSITFSHPERGQMTIGDLLDMLAGHELHHLAHLEKIART